ADLAANCLTTRARTPGSSGGRSTATLLLVSGGDGAAPVSQVNSGSGSQTGATVASTGNNMSATKADNSTAPRTAGPAFRVASQAKTPRRVTSVPWSRASANQGPAAKMLSASFMASSPLR